MFVRPYKWLQFKFYHYMLSLKTIARIIHDNLLFSPSSDADVLKYKNYT